MNAGDVIIVERTIDWANDYRKNSTAVALPPGWDTKKAILALSYLPWDVLRLDTIHCRLYGNLTILAVRPHICESCGWTEELCQMLNSVSLHQASLGRNWSVPIHQAALFQTDPVSRIRMAHTPKKVAGCKL